MATKKKKKAKKTAKKAKTAAKKTARKTAKKIPAKKKSGKKASAKKVSAKKATAKKVPAKKAVKKAVKKTAKKKKQTIGEGNYEASRAFDKDQAAFVAKNKDRIPELGKQAEAALEGPEGDALREAEAEAGARSRDIF